MRCTSIQSSRNRLLFCLQIFAGPVSKVLMNPLPTSKIVNLGYSLPRICESATLDIM
jgi:hypothetical protein